MKNLNKMKIAGDMQFEIGQDKVSHFPGMDVKDDETLLSRLLAMKRSTFDRSKFTVVGNLTITDDGIASGFSGSNYIKTLSITELGKITESIRFTSSFVYNTLSEQTIWNRNLNFDFRLNNGSIILRTYDGTKANVFSIPQSQHKVTDGAQVFCDVVITSSLCSIKINGVEFTKIQVTDFSYLTNSVDKNFLIGMSNAYDLYFQKSIDLKQFSITVDGKEVFSGNETGIDTIKSDNYEVVGSSVISNDGIASGFSTENYINTGFIVDLTKPNQEFEFGFTTGSETSSSSNRFICSTTNRTFALNFNTYNRLDFSYNTSSTTTGYGKTIGTTILSPNTKYFVKISTKFNSVRVYVRKENEIYNTYAEGELPTVKIDNQILYLGIHKPSGNGYFTGSIDLNSLKIYVDDNLAYQPCLKIPYTRSKAGSKIVDSVYRDRVQDMYEQYGYTHYYTVGNTDFTLATCKGSDVVESGENYEQTADLTLKQWGSATSGQTVNLLPYKDTNYAVTLTNGSKTKSSFVANATGDYFAVGKVVL